MVTFWEDFSRADSEDGEQRSVGSVPTCRYTRGEEEKKTRITEKGLNSLYLSCLTDHRQVVCPCPCICIYVYLYICVSVYVYVQRKKRKMSDTDTQYR